MQFDGIVDLSEVRTTEENLQDFLGQVRQSFGFDHVAYAGMHALSGTILGDVTYPEEWRRLYLDRNFARIDPTLRMAARSIGPVDWSRLRGQPSFNEVFRSAADFGIPKQGMTIPVRGPYGDTGLFSVVQSGPATEWNRKRSRYVGDLQSLAVHLHDRVISSHDLSAAITRPSISSREREILQWVAAGKTQQDISDILSISQRTVEVHLRSARDKLGALTTPQAIARAIGIGIVYPM